MRERMGGEGFRERMGDEGFRVRMGGEGMRERMGERVEGKDGRSVIGGRGTGDRGKRYRGGGGEESHLVDKNNPRPRLPATHRLYRSVTV